MFTVKHPFVSGLPDGLSPSLVKPSDWDASHSLVGSAALGYTPVITPQTGSLVGHTLSTAGRYGVFGKLVYLQLYVSVTVGGTGSPGGAVQVSLPGGMALASVTTMHGMNAATVVASLGYGAAADTGLKFFSNAGASLWPTFQLWAQGMIEVS